MKASARVRFQDVKPYDVLSAYQAEISEGMLSDQEAILNPSLLLRVWSELVLSVRVRELWESRFPE